MCALALAGKRLSGARAPLIYEVLDVQRVFLGSGPVSRLFRWAERQLLKRSDLLVVSSPGFDRHYFRSVQGYRGRLFLLENRSEEHTSELQSLMRNSYAVFCLKKK